MNTLVPQRQQRTYRRRSRLGSVLLFLLPVLALLIWFTRGGGADGGSETVHRVAAAATDVSANGESSSVLPMLVLAVFLAALLFVGAIRLMFRMFGIVTKALELFVAIQWSAALAGIVTVTVIVLISIA